MVDLVSVDNNTAAPGMQIAYVPRHVFDMWACFPEKMLENGAVEYGFVTTVTSVVFCRFYYRSEPAQLRTTANSEACFTGKLYVLPEEYRRPQEEIDEFMRAHYPYKLESDK